jgi:cytochrome c oxidase subunit I
MRAGSVALRTPMLWAIGFVIVSAIGGLDVVALAYVRVSSTLQDTYFVAGYEHWHIHYVLWWAAVFGIFAGWYYLFPKISRRTYSDFLGKVHFWLSLISATILVPQNIVVEGIRRVTVNLNAFDIWIWNLVSSIGPYIFAAGILVFFANMALAFLRRQPAD